MFAIRVDSPALWRRTPGMHRTLILLLGCVCASMAAACTNANAPTPVASYDPQAVPTGAVGDLIRYGHDIIADTPKYMKPYIGADMSCAACHIAAGTVPRGGYLGVYGEFPQWNTRAHRVISLQDRLAECFLYSMNGHPPAYNSREMEAMVAYIAWLSRGWPVGSHVDPTLKYARFAAPQAPSPQRGSQIYAQKCAVCHRADGTGVSGTYPPLWGARSFNHLAGMAHIDRMVGFVRYNMPQNAPGSLSDQEAYDVSAFILAHARPAFRGNRSIAFPPLPAKYF
jgi:thiosulfate dehydrogenase